MNLLEAYKGRLAVSEKFYAQTNGGAKMDSTKKMIVAQCLDNTSKYINESFANSVGTQRSDLGMYKRFCLDITTLTLPNLIVNDLFMVKPMASFSGYLTYMQFALGTPKGGVGGPKLNADGTFAEPVQDPFMWAPMTEDRARYTGEKVVEVAAAGEFVPAWKPIVGDKVIALDAEGAETEVAADSEGKFVLPEGTVKVKYEYDNQIVPQEKLPTLVGKMAGITLTARARRIAIQYSQFAAFQS